MAPRGDLERLATAYRLADGGQYAAVVTYLSPAATEGLGSSPTLALLYGTAHARLGRHTEGTRWVDRALAGARERCDHTIEIRALNVRGAIALEAGRTEEAVEALTRGLAAAQAQGEQASVGRCATNLGIIANMRGQFDDAVGWYTRALTAFEQASLPWGVVMVHHNLGITYRDQRRLALAFEMADKAVTEAADVGDQALAAQTLAGRAEIRALSGDGAVARREIERALAIHRELSDEVREAEDLRILATVLTALGETGEVETLLRDVVRRANGHQRPLLAATARRDLAALLVQAGRAAEAGREARTARALFTELGATAEAERLDRLLE